MRIMWNLHRDELDLTGLGDLLGLGIQLFQSLKLWKSKSYADNVELTQR